MHLPPSSHHLRYETESQQFPLTRQMSGFSEGTCAASRTIVAPTTSAFPPSWAILSTYLQAPKSSCNALRLHEFENSCCHQPVPCASVEEPRIPRQRHRYFLQMALRMLPSLSALLKQPGPGCLLSAFWQGHKQWSVLQTHAVFLWFVHMKVSGQDGLWIRRTAFTLWARAGIQLFQTGSRLGQMDD